MFTKNGSKIASSTVSNEETAACRICLEPEPVASLRKQCDCSGTVGLAHDECIAKWVRISSAEVCEMCRTEFYNLPTPICTVSPLMGSLGIMTIATITVTILYYVAP